MGAHQAILGNPSFAQRLNLPHIASCMPRFASTVPTRHIPTLRQIHSYRPTIIINVFPFFMCFLCFLCYRFGNVMFHTVTFWRDTLRNVDALCCVRLVAATNAHLCRRKRLRTKISRLGNKPKLSVSASVCLSANGSGIYRSGRGVCA